MELVDQWDDEEQPLVIDEDNIEHPYSGIRVTNPFEPEMVAVTPEGAGAPAQGSTTPKAAATPDPKAGTPEKVSTPGDETQQNQISNSLSIEAIKASLDMVLAASGNMAPPDVKSSQNLWASFNMGSAPEGSSSLAPSNSILAPIFTKLSEQERNKMTTDLIISCIQQQKVLWDSSDPSFGDSKLCTLLWRNIASVCGFDVKKLKSKWYALKYTFKKEYIKSSSTGITSKSPNFAAMSFLEGEIQRELQRESSEKISAVKQLLRRNVGNERQGDTEDSIVLDVDEDDSIGSNDEDCMIVESELKGSTQSPPLSGTTDTGISSSSRANNSKGDLGLQSVATVSKSIRAKDISELRNKRPQIPESSQGAESSSSNERRRSPEVTCLGEPQEPKKSTKQQYTAVPGQPVIKYKPAADIQDSQSSTMKIEVEDGMPKDWNRENPNSESEAPPKQQAPPAVIKQCAKKSISRANLTLFSKPNGARNPITPLKPPDETENTIPWKIENPRTVQIAQTSVKQCAELPKNEFPEQDCNNMIADPLKPEPMEDDEIQIIKEVHRPSAFKGTTSHPPIETRKNKTNEDQPVPQKKPQISPDQPAPPKISQPFTDQPLPPKKPRIPTDQPPVNSQVSIDAESRPPPQVTRKRKVDKNREKSANEHFLLSLLYDVETMTNKQFRRFKKRSTALVSMILDPR